MANKRRRQGSNEHVSKPKKARFTLENVHLPEVDVEGIVLAMGTGDVGQLGLGPDVLEKSRPALVKLDQPIVDIYAGGMHTVCLTKEGKVLTFGCNDEGALGRVTDGKEEAEFVAGEVELPGKVVQISAGDSHTAALLEDGRVFAWGTFRDSHGNMGMTINGNEKVPYQIIKNVLVKKIASGADHIVFLTDHGEVYTCGCAEQGQLGRTSERTSGRDARNGIARLLEPHLINLKPSKRLHFDNIWASTYGTYCKVANNDDIYVSGLNNYNQIGLSELTPYFIPTLSPDFSQHKWEMLSSGEHHTIGLDVDGKVYAIGRKDYGRLGLGTNLEKDASSLQRVEKLDGKTIVHVACGSSTSFAVTKEGDLFGWGMGTNGQLGTGEEDDCEVPTLIKSKQLLDKKVFRVSSGGQHTVILASQVDAKCNGDQ